MKKYNMIVIRVSIFLIYFVIAGNTSIQNQKIALLNDLKVWENHYYSGGIDVAMNETIKLLEKIKYYKKLGVEGFNYQLLISSSYIRLYLIEMEKGLPDKANAYLGEYRTIWVEEFMDDNSRIAPEKMDEELFNAVEFIREMDCENSVKWLNCDGVENKYR